MDWQSLGSSATFIFLDGIHLMKTIGSKYIPVCIGISDAKFTNAVYPYIPHSTSLKTSKNIKFKDNVSSKSHLIVRYLCKLGIEQATWQFYKVRKYFPQNDSFLLLSWFEISLIIAAVSFTVLRNCLTQVMVHQDFQIIPKVFIISDTVIIPY